MKNIEEYYLKYLIKETAKMFNVSPWIIRHYEKYGLIESMKDDNSSYRKFDIHMIEQLSNILMLRSMDFSLEDICKIKDFYDTDINGFLDLLNEQYELVQKKIKTYQNISDKLMNFQKELNEINKSKNNIIIKDLPKLFFYDIYDKLDPKTLEFDYSKLMNNSTQSPKFTFFTNKDEIINKKVDLNSYFQFGVSKLFIDDDIHEGIVIPGKKCVYSLNIGYGIENLNLKYVEMMDWIEENNYTITDNAIEFCNFCIGNNYILEIYIPVDSKK